MSTMNGHNHDTIPPALRLYERAARIYCDRTGLDADATAQVPHPLLAGQTVESWLQWTQIAERLMDLSQLLGAMKAAVSEAPAVRAVQ